MKFAQCITLYLYFSNLFICQTSKTELLRKNNPYFFSSVFTNSTASNIISARTETINFRISTKGAQTESPVSEKIIDVPGSFCRADSPTGCSNGFPEECPQGYFQESTLLEIYGRTSVGQPLFPYCFAKFIRI